MPQSRKRSASKKPSSPARRPKTPVFLANWKSRLQFFSRVTSFGLPLYLLISLVALPILLSLIIILKDLPAPPSFTTPAPASLTNSPIPQTTKILDRHGQLLYNIYVSENRTVIPFSDIPLAMRQATIAIEDKDFYRHGGINFVGGILRAVKDMILY